MNCRYLATLALLAVLIPQAAFAAPVRCECARYLRTVLHVNVPQGDADTYRPTIPQSDIQEGDVLIQKFGRVWHVALVIGFGETEVNPFDLSAQVPKIIVSDSNFIRCTPTVRAISWFDDNIVGVYRPT